MNGSPWSAAVLGISSRLQFFVPPLLLILMMLLLLLLLPNDVSFTFLFDQERGGKRKSGATSFSPSRVRFDGVEHGAIGGGPAQPPFKF